MRMVDNNPSLQNERTMVLSLNSKTPILLLSGLLASIAVLVIIASLLYFFHTFGANSSTFIIPTSSIIYFAIFIMAFGIITARLQTVEFALHHAASRGSGSLDVFASGLHFIFPAAIFGFIFIILQSLQILKSEDPWSTNMLYLIIDIFITIVVQHLWHFFFERVLSLITNIDWHLIIDKDRFNHMLRLRFDESKRYPGPLTLVIIGLGNFDEIKNKVSKKALLKYQHEMITFVDKLLRTVDIVARIEEGQYISIIQHTSAIESKIPAERIISLAKDISIKTGKNKSIIPDFRFGVASFDTKMQHERELYEKAMKAVHDSNEDNKVVIV